MALWGLRWGCGVEGSVARYQRDLGNSGYCDMLLLLSINGYVCELQLNFEAVFSGELWCVLSLRVDPLGADLQGQLSCGAELAKKPHPAALAGDERSEDE